MKAYEAIKKLKADRKEFLEQYGIKSHMSNIPPELEAELFGEEKKIETEPEPTQTVDSAETDVVTVEPSEEECPYTLKQIEMGCKLGGNKSKTWQWRHLIG